MYGKIQIYKVFQEFEFLKKENTSDWAVYFYNNHDKFSEQIGDFNGSDVSEHLRKFRTLQEIFDAFR